jgi:hypothetical protein
MAASIAALSGSLTMVAHLGFKIFRKLLPPSACRLAPPLPLCTEAVRETRLGPAPYTKPPVYARLHGFAMLAHWNINSRS